MLFGEFRHSIDAKNRVSIPSKMRDELGGEFVIAPSVRNDCMRFFSMSAWKEYLLLLKEKQRALAETGFWLFFSKGTEVSPDSLGRVLLPKSLLDYAKLKPDTEEGRNVVIVGCGDYGEIWLESNYEKYVQSMDIDAIRRALAESGL